MKPKSPKHSETRNKPTLVAFLLDRTGSMAQCRDETIKGFNGYLKELKSKAKEKIHFSLTQFDSIGIDLIHDAVPLKEVQELNLDTYEPRAQTSLYDAIGKTIRAIEKKAADKFQVLFVTLTDGLENASSEWNQATIKSLIQEKESKDHWTFAHIGVGANGWAATTALAAGTQSASNVLQINPKDTVKTYARFASTTRCYASNSAAGGQSVNNLWSGTKSEEDEE